MTKRVLNLIDSNAAKIDCIVNIWLRSKDLFILLLYVRRVNNTKSMTI